MRDANRLRSCKPRLVLPDSVLPRVRSSLAEREVSVSVS